MKIKRIFIIFLIIIFLLGNSVFADDEVEEIDSGELESIYSSSDTTEEPSTYSKYIICIDRNTEQVLYEKDAYTRTPMASTTKIMTAIITLEKCDLSEEVEISNKAANTGGSTFGITAGSKIKLQTLLYGLLLRSGNDCAVAIAEYIGGTVEGFATIMNEKAKELGLVNTHFVTPHGLDNNNHYTTAYDLAILTNYALNNEKFRNIVGTTQTSMPVSTYMRSMNNTNELLGRVDGVYGVKTGFTGNAGRCLVTACKRDDLDIIIVVLGADTKKIRGLDTKKVIDYVFANYEIINTYDLLINKFEDFKKNKIIGTYKSDEEISLELEKINNYSYPINKNKIKDLKVSIYSISVVNSPKIKNTKIGNIKVFCEDKFLYSIDIILNNDITKKKWNEYLITFLKNYKLYFKI